jgi:hypothetical protein
MAALSIAEAKLFFAEAEKTEIRGKESIEETTIEEIPGQLTFWDLFQAEIANQSDLQFEPAA